MVSGGVILLSILGSFAALVFQGIMASSFQSIAEEKGWHSSKYFWICFFFGACGWIMVAALPDRAGSVPQTPLTDTPAQNAGIMKTDEKFVTLYEGKKNLYAEGSPLVIREGTLIKNTQTDQVMIRLKLYSLMEKSIKAAEIVFSLADSFGADKGVQQQMYLDLQCERYQSFGDDTYVLLKDNTVRSFSVKRLKVFYSDNSYYETETEDWTPIEQAELIFNALKSFEVADAYHKIYGGNARYIYKESKDLWRCTCGALNRDSETECCCCHTERTKLIGFSPVAFTVQVAREMMEQKHYKQAERILDPVKDQPEAGALLAEIERIRKHR